MNKQPSRVGLYLGLIIMLVAAYLFLNDQVNNQSSFTLTQFEEALEENQISQVEIHPQQGSAHRADQRDPDLRRTGGFLCNRCGRSAGSAGRNGCVYDSV